MLSVVDTEADGHTTVLERFVSHQRARQEVRLAEDLEAVADADDRLARLGVLDDGLHHRRKAGDRAGAKVVAVGEAAWEDDAIVRGEVGLAVPDEVSFVAHDVPQGVLRVVVAPGAGENDDGEAHVCRHYHMTILLTVIFERSEKLAVCTT